MNSDHRVCQSFHPFLAHEESYSWVMVRPGFQHRSHRHLLRSALFTRLLLTHLQYSLQFVTPILLILLLSALRKMLPSNYQAFKIEPLPDQLSSSIGFMVRLAVALLCLFIQPLISFVRCLSACLLVFYFSCDLVLAWSLLLQVFEARFSATR